MFINKARRHGGLAQPAILLRAHRGAFTLIEVAFATVVVGLGVVTLMHAMGAGTRVNGEARKITQAVFLSQEIREWTLNLPFSDPQEPSDVEPGPDAANSPAQFVDDVDDLYNPNTYTFSPPRNGQGNVIPGMTAWGQKIHMEWRDEDNLSMFQAVGASDVICVTVTIQKDRKDVLTTSWLVTRRDN